MSNDQNPKLEPVAWQFHLDELQLEILQKAITDEMVRMGVTTPRAGCDSKIQTEALVNICLRKLFVFRPLSHGPSSFFVMAKNESEANATIEKFITEETERSILKGYDFDAEGFGTEDYELIVFEPGQVATNDNL
jgi:hypothetical protein